jgi:O-antigen ligase
VKEIKNSNLAITLEKFQVYLFILIPFFLITGPFLSDLSVSLIALIKLYLIFKYKKFEIFKSFYIKLFFLFWIYILLNSLLINFDLNALKISFFYFRFLFFTIAIIDLLEKNYNILSKLFYSLLFCFIILIFDGFYQYFTGFNIIGLKLPSGPRASSFFGDELILGSYLSRLLPIFFGLILFLFKDNKKKIFLLSSVLVFIETLVFISGERTAFFYINLSAVFIIIFINEYKILRLLTLIFSIGFIFIILSFNENIKTRMVDTTLDQIGYNKDEKYILSEEHQDQFFTAINMFKQNKISGVGIKNFRDLCDEEMYKSGNYSCSTHPHNIYLQFLSELGFIGFLFILTILMIFSFKVINHFYMMTFKKKNIFNNLEICLLSSVLITLWPLGPSGNFFNNWLSVIFYLPLPILFWSIKSRIKNLQI